MNMMKMASIEEAANDAWETRGDLRASIVEDSKKDTAYLCYYLGFLAGVRYGNTKAAEPNTALQEAKLIDLKEELRSIAKYADDMNWRSITKKANKALAALAQAANEEKNEKDNQV